MSDAGFLRHRLVIEAPVETPDGAGGVTRAHVDVATVWGRVLPQRPTERVDEDRLGGILTHKVVIRFRADVLPGWSVRKGERRLRILSLRETGFDERFLELSCEEER